MQVVSNYTILYANFTCMLVFWDIFISLIFSFVCDCLFGLYINKECWCLLVKMLYSKGLVDFCDPNASPSQPWATSEAGANLKSSPNVNFFPLFSGLWLTSARFGLWSDPTHCQLIFLFIFCQSWSHAVSWCCCSQSWHAQFPRQADCSC